jgi:signal peptidase I
MTMLPGGRIRTWARRAADVALVTLVLVAMFGVVLGRLVPLTGRSTFVVAGGSMEPAIPLGAAVVVEPVRPADLAVGDIVSLKSGPKQSVFTHRVIRVAELDGQVAIETRGDANLTADPSLTPASAVIGRVTVTIPFAGFLVALLSIPSGVLFVIAIGAVLLLISWLLDDPSDGDPATAPRTRVPAKRAALRRAATRSLAAKRTASRRSGSIRADGGA